MLFEVVPLTSTIMYGGDSMNEVTKLILIEPVISHDNPGSLHADVASKNRLMLADFLQPSYNQRKRVVRQRLGAISSASPERRIRAAQGLVGLSEWILDGLVTFL